jgi:hypothetical protein
VRACGALEPTVSSVRAARRSEMEGVYLVVLVLAFVGLGVACLYVAYKLLVR